MFTLQHVLLDSTVDEDEDEVYSYIINILYLSLLETKAHCGHLWCSPWVSHVQTSPAGMSYHVAPPLHRTIHWGADSWCQMVSRVDSCSPQHQKHLPGVRGGAGRSASASPCARASRCTCTRCGWTFCRASCSPGSAIASSGVKHKCLCSD